MKRSDMMVKDERVGRDSEGWKNRIWWRKTEGSDMMVKDETIGHDGEGWKGRT
jgi:hypothetical protein